MSEKQLTSSPVKKTVADPSDSYNTLLPLWKRSRAILQGEANAKQHDETVNEDSNLLLAFSNSMSQAQYDFFKKEAELPGLSAQYAKSLVASLLRKESTLAVNVEGMSDEDKVKATKWIRDDFTLNGRSLFSFLDEAVWEELQTFNSWVYVDLATSEDEEEENDFKPYATLIKAENVINVQEGMNTGGGKRGVQRFVTRYISQRFTEENPWHPTYVDTVCDHYLDDSGHLVMDYWEREGIDGNAVSKNGIIQNNSLVATQEVKFNKVKTVYPKRLGENLTVIPAWPLNGQYVSSEPVLQPLIDREVSLYNKIARRNHLMYGASTFTPVVTGVTDPDAQQAIISAGLGSYVFLPDEASMAMLETPSSALADMDRSIAATVDEMAKMGIRMLSPESAQSGVALELRNASQTAQLGTLNTKISEVMTSVIAFMLWWRYEFDVSPSDIDYALSADFSPVAGGEGAMRLVTEWYEKGIIPRTTFLAIARFNDFIPADYDDRAALTEIESDPLTLSKSVNDDNFVDEDSFE
jgi:hypothetical protein